MVELISIHIPKTAGRSFLAILQSVYGSDLVMHFDRKNYPDKSVPDAEQFKKQLNEKIKIIHGHFRYKEIRDLKDFKNAKLIMWVRNPVDRVISNYSFFKKRITLAPNDAELQKRKNESLLEYAFKDDTRNLMNQFIEGLKLDDFYFIGVMEYFDTELIKLAELLNWGSFEIPRINDNSSFKAQLPIVTDEEKILIENLNAKDIDLYSKVLELRNDRLT